MWEMELFKNGIAERTTQLSDFPDLYKIWTPCANDLNKIWGEEHKFTVMYTCIK